MSTEVSRGQSLQEEAPSSPLGKLRVKKKKKKEFCAESAFFARRRLAPVSELGSNILPWVQRPF